MPYKNIHWIKLLFKDLLADPEGRFIEQLNDDQKGLYLMLLLLAGFYQNQIPNDPGIFKRMLNLSQKSAEISQNLAEIFKIFNRTFPEKVASSKYIKFKNFNKLHNPIRTAEGTPKSGVEKRRVEEIREEYITLKGWNKEDLQPNDYARIHKGIKNLLLKTQGKADLAIAALGWQAKQGYEWTIETIVKKYADFRAFCPKCQNKGSFVNERGYKQTCECAKGKAIKSEDNPRR